MDHRDGERMQAEETKKLGKGWAAAGVSGCRWISGGGGPPGPAFEEAALAGSFWWVELPGPGVRKATSTHYSPKACVLGLMGNILSMASLQGPAVEKDAPLATPVVSPENTILGGKSFLYTPNLLQSIEER